MADIRNIKIIFPGARIATSDTNYRLLADLSEPDIFAEVLTLSATAGPGGSYSAVETVLSEDITREEDEIQMPSGNEASFPAGSYAVVGRELVQLGALGAGDPVIYTGCKRGFGGTLREAYDSGTTVKSAHESVELNLVTFSDDRHVIRYRIQPLHLGQEGEPHEVLAINPSLPEDDSITTIFGVMQDVEGQPLAGLAVSLSFVGSDPVYLPASGEFIFPAGDTATTNAEGYFEVSGPRDVSRVGSAIFTLKIQSADNAKESIEWNVEQIPDLPFVHFRETRVL